jgi:two-component system nitrogen regulation sensor histidine kinase NtrY
VRREIAQELLQQSVFLQRVAHSDIVFTVKAPEAPLYFECDGRLVSQALTNVLKNAAEAVSARHAKGDDIPGAISASLERTDENLIFRIADNGVGLPHDQRHRLTEPYVTTRAKGTGLGLAIVRKIVEDHGGELNLSDRAEDEPGAEVRLTFPLYQKKSQDTRKIGTDDEQERIANRA